MAYLTNIDVFLSIAEESHAAMKTAFESGRRPKPDGSGYIFTLDTHRTSFKHACITVAFAAMYFEALIYLLALRELGKDEAIKVDRMLYEHRLERIQIARLIVDDQDLRNVARFFHLIPPDRARRAAATGADRCSRAWRCSPTRPPEDTFRDRPSSPWQ